VAQMGWSIVRLWRPQRILCSSGRASHSRGYIRKHRFCTTLSWRQRIMMHIQSVVPYRELSHLRAAPAAAPLAARLQGVSPPSALAAPATGPAAGALLPLGAPLVVAVLAAQALPLVVPAAQAATCSMPSAECPDLPCSLGTPHVLQNALSQRLLHAAASYTWSEAAITDRCHTQATPHEPEQAHPSKDG
jgi:hypothetical protein